MTTPENPRLPPEYRQRLEATCYTPPAPVHFMTHTHTQNGVTGTFTCTAGPEAPCHWYPDAEEWTEGDGQPRMPHDECWIGPWMDNGCAETCGPEHDPVQGHAAIDVEHNGCVVWWYRTLPAGCTCEQRYDALGPEPERIPSPDCPFPQHHPEQMQ